MTRPLTRAIVLACFAVALDVYGLYGSNQAARCLAILVAIVFWLEIRRELHEEAGEPARMCEHNWRIYLRPKDEAWNELRAECRVCGENRPAFYQWRPEGLVARVGEPPLGEAFMVIRTEKDKSK